MRVKIKGIKELQDAMYSFDDNGKLAGIVLCEDADNGIYNTYPMDLVQNIFVQIYAMEKVKEQMVLTIVLQVVK